MAPRDRLSKNLYVIAPDSTASEAEIAAAMDRHDGLRAGWGGPKPGWFQTVERVGRWWYLIAAVLGSVSFILFAPNEASGAGEAGRGAAMDQIQER